MSINKIGKSKVDISQLKAGLEFSKVKGDAKMESVFKKIDTDDNNVLTQDEIDKFKQNFDKDQNDIATKKEARKFIKENGLKEDKVKKKDVMAFLRNYGENVDNVSDTQTLENGSVRITYTDGSQKILNQDKTYDTITTNEDTTTTTSYNENDVKQKEIIDSDQKKTETTFENGLRAQSVTTYNDGSGIVETINYKSDKPSTKTVEQGNNFSEYEYLPNGQERITHKLENKGHPVLEKETDYSYNDDGSYTETITQNGTNTKTTNTCNSEGKRLEQQKTVDGKEYSVTYDGQGNTTGIVIQAGENIEQIAKKFGCTVEQLQELNGKEKFEVGDTIKVPGEKESDMPELQNRKSSEESIQEQQKQEELKARQQLIAQQQKAKQAQLKAQLKAQREAETAALKQNLGLKNRNGEGTKVKAHYSNSGREVTLTKIGDATYGRTICKGKDGKYIIVAHDGVIISEKYVKVHKAWVQTPKDQRGKTVSGMSNVSYIKDENGKVWYFDEKTGKAIVKGNYTQIVKQESAFVANQLHKAAKNDDAWYNALGTGAGVDKELLEKGVKSIYSRDILQGVNAQLKAKDSDYAGDAQTMPIEALILDEMSHGAARPLFRALINSGTMSVTEQAHTVKREIEHEVHGGFGITQTADLSEVMQLCSDPAVRREIEAQFKKDHPELKENEGSIVRSYIADDGWNAQEVDQFDANWIKTGAYQEAQAYYVVDENGNFMVDEAGNYIIQVDAGDQEHRNAVIGRLVFDYQDKEALNKGLEVINEHPGSFDYQYLDQRAGEEIANDPDGKYQSRFTNQDNVQRYLAGFHSDVNGSVDAGELSTSNTILFKGEKPPFVQAQESLYKAKNGDFSQAFDSMDAETYSVIATLVASGDIKGVKNMADLYNKALNSATNSNDKTKIKANAILSGQLKDNFTDEQIADFCIELMHSIDDNIGRGGSTGRSAGYTNDADYQTEQLKAILQNNPQVMNAVRARVEKEDFHKTTTVQGIEEAAQIIVTDTKDKYLEILANTKNIANDEIFLDKDGKRITDSTQIKAIKEANMQSLQQMRQYVAELERDFRKGVDAEGLLSDMANGLSEYSGKGTDRDDVATEYKNAKLMLQQFEAAAQGRLRDSKGKVISAQDLAKQVLNKQQELAKTNSDYSQTITYGKMGIVLAPVIAATTIASGGAAAAGWGTLGAAAAGGVAAGATTYGVNALEYNTSYTGNTAEAREQNLKDSIVNGATTAVGIGQMKYVMSIGNTLGTVARTGVRLATTIGLDTTVGMGAEYTATGNISAQGTMMNIGMSAVGNIIGAHALGQKQAAGAHQEPGLVRYDSNKDGAITHSTTNRSSYYNNPNSKVTNTNPAVANSSLHYSISSEEAVLASKLKNKFSAFFTSNDVDRNKIKEIVKILHPEKCGFSTDLFYRAVELLKAKTPNQQAAAKAKLWDAINGKAVSAPNKTPHAQQVKTQVRESSTPKPKQTSNVNQSAFDKSVKTIQSKISKASSTEELINIYESISNYPKDQQQAILEQANKLLDERCSKLISKGKDKLNPNEREVAVFGIHNWVSRRTKYFESLGYTQSHAIEMARADSMYMQYSKKWQNPTAKFGNAEPLTNQSAHINPTGTTPSSNQFSGVKSNLNLNDLKVGGIINDRITGEHKIIEVIQQNGRTKVSYRALDRKSITTEIIDSQGNILEKTVSYAHGGKDKIVYGDKNNPRYWSDENPNANWSVRTDKKGSAVLNLLMRGQEIDIPNTHKVRAKLNKDGTMTVKLSDYVQDPESSNAHIAIAKGNGTSISYKGQATITVEPGEKVLFYTGHEGYLSCKIEVPRVYQ